MGASLARLGMVAASLGLLVSIPVSPAYAGGSNLQTLINQDRASNGGLAALAWSDCLAAVAGQNAQRIAAQGFLSHTDGPELGLACEIGRASCRERVQISVGGGGGAR